MIQLSGKVNQIEVKIYLQRHRETLLSWRYQHFLSQGNLFDLTSIDIFEEILLLIAIAKTFAISFRPCFMSFHLPALEIRNLRHIHLPLHPYGTNGDALAPQIKRHPAVVHNLYKTIFVVQDGFAARVGVASHQPERVPDARRFARGRAENAPVRKFLRGVYFSVRQHAGKIQTLNVT